MGGVIFIIKPYYYIYYFISLETGNTHKSEVFLLKIYSGKVNASIVTC